MMTLDQARKLLAVVTSMPGGIDNFNPIEQACILVTADQQQRIEALETVLLHPVMTLVSPQQGRQAGLAERVNVIDVRDADRVTRLYVPEREG